MAEKSSISWTDASWNPTVGCTKVSPGCDHCYAEVLALRLRDRGSAKYALGFQPRPWEPDLDLPRRWRRPRRVFVNSMSDPFHRSIPREYVRLVWEVMLQTPRHTYQVLTKRPHRMAHAIRELELPVPDHIWLGVSAETQALAENRLPALLQIPAAVRWVSAEPLLGPLDLGAWLASDRINWLVSGAESGPGRREPDPDWFRSLRNQCRQAEVPYYHKQGSAHHPGRRREIDGVIHDALPEFPAS